MSKGYVRRRGERDAQGRFPWELRFDLPAANGMRRTQYHSFRGTAREARAKLRELMGAADKGTYVEPSKLTIAEYMRARLEKWRERTGAKTAERNREIVEGQIIPHLGKIAVQKLTVLDIEAWHTTLKTSGRKDGKGGLGARTIGHAHRLLSKALKEAARRDLVFRNVAALESAPRTNRPEIQILGADQIKQLIAAQKGRPLYPHIVTALYTGARRGELLALRWRDFDAKAKTLAVREALELTKGHNVSFKSPKTESGVRTITLPDIVVDALCDHERAQLALQAALIGPAPRPAPRPAPMPENVASLRPGKSDKPNAMAADALIFPALDDGPRNPRNFSKAWARIAKAQGFQGVTLHALRHTCASLLIAAGVDVVTIAYRLGHKSPTITLNTYAHLFTRHDDKAAGALNAHVAELAI
jgi:integrase